MSGQIIDIVRVKILPDQIARNLLVPAGEKALVQWLAESGALVRAFHFVAGKRSALGDRFDVPNECPDTNQECLVWFLSQLERGVDLELAIAFPPNPPA